MNGVLEQAYEDFRVRVCLPEYLLNKASAPLLLKISGAWPLAVKRVLVVGQETNGWQSQDGSIRTLQHFKERSDGVCVLQNAYEAFAVGENYRFRNSAFWRAFRILTAGSAGMWTNLFRSDVNGPVLLNCTRQEQRQLLGQQSDLLLHEISVLQPTAIVFLTGPRYDGALREGLGNVFLSSLWKDVSVSKAAAVKSPLINIPSMRLYHPTYLQRSRQWNVLLRAAQLLDSL